MSVVYRHIRLDKNEPFYIGIGKTEKRAYNKHNRNRHWKSIIANTSYRVEILFDDLSWEKAIEKEIELIELYGRKDLGLGTLVNLTDGGESLPGSKNPMFGKKRTDDEKRRISQKLTGSKLSEETKLKISQSGKGRIFSEEHLSKLRGRKLSLNHVEKLKNRVFTTEYRHKLSESMKGNTNGIKGILKQQQDIMRPVMIEGVEYKSITEASNSFGLSHGAVRYRLKSDNEKFVNWNYTI
jgi:hypothetical protein